MSRVSSLRSYLLPISFLGVGLIVWVVIKRGGDRITETEPGPVARVARSHGDPRPTSAEPGNASRPRSAADGTAVIRSALTGGPRERLTALGTNHNAAGVSPDGRWVVVGGPTQHLSVWDRHHQGVVTNLTVASGDIQAIRFDAPGRLLRVVTVLPSPGGTMVTLVDTRDWRELNSWKVEHRSEWGLAWSPDDRLAVLGTSDATVTWLDANTGRELEVTQGPVGAMAPAFSSDSRSLVTPSWVDGRMVFWDTDTRRVTRPPLRIHLQAAGGVAFSSDGRRLATGGVLREEGIKIWDTETLSELMTLSTPNGFIQNLAFSPDGNSLLALTAGLFPTVSIYLWHVPSLAQIDAGEPR